MGKSLKENYILNLANTILGIIFPLITFPYVSRILLADGIGLVEFYNSIIGYISLFSAIGIPLYAIRESARVRDDKKKLSITTTEILILHTSLTLIGYIVVGVICLTVARVQENIPLFLLLSTSMFLTAIGVNWFYQGIEDFKYITVRNIFVKIVSLLLIFAFIHNRNDLIWYAGISVVGNVGSNVFNFFRLRKHISLSCFQFNELHPLKHIAPALKIFILNLVISLYTQLDVLMLGFIKDSNAVGYYTASTKITTVLLSIAASLGQVLLPRLSNLIAAGNKAEYNRLSQKAVDFIFFISLPMTVGVAILAPSIIHLFAGSSFEPSIMCLQIVSPIVFIIALSNVIGIQMLYPLGKENIVTASTVVGAVVNIGLNIWLIPLYSQNGAAIATVVAQIGVTLTQILISRKFVTVNFFSSNNVYILFASFFMGAICWLFSLLISNDVFRLITILLLGGIIYSILIYLKKIPLVMEFYSIVKKHLNGN